MSKETENIEQGKNKALHIGGVSGALLVEDIAKLLKQYRDEEMPDWNSPYQYEAEGWAAMQHFIKWLERRCNDR